MLNHWVLYATGIYLINEKCLPSLEKEEAAILLSAGIKIETPTTYNSTTLNRLNYLGIKGNIGGSDRKRLRNLINKGTTIEGTIRKKQGGKLKLIKRYGWKTIEKRIWWLCSGNSKWNF